MKNNVSKNKLDLKDEFVENVIEGRNAVIEALKSGKTIEQIFISNGEITGSINKILTLAREKKIVVKRVDKKKLNKISYTGAHQGVIAKCSSYKYYELEDILAFSKQKKQNPFIVILDGIEDPHNFGSIIRTAEVCGVHGIIIPKRRNVGVTPVVYKSSVGAVEHMKICKVSNLSLAINKLKKDGVWIYGADMSGEKYCFDTNFNDGVALVIGSEGRGISELIKKRCDILVKIPMLGNITSLNASMAGGIIMYEILRQKLKDNKS